MTLRPTDHRAPLFARDLPLRAFAAVILCSAGCASTSPVTPPGDTGGAASGSTGGAGGMALSSGNGSSSGGGGASVTTTPATFRTLLTGQYLSATNGGGSALTAGSAAVAADETFTLTDLDGGALLDGDEVHLASTKGQYVSAKNGGGDTVDVSATTAGDNETFVIKRIAGPAPIVSGDRIALETKLKVNYLSAIDGGGGAVRADAPWIKEWETFTIHLDSSSSSSTTSSSSSSGSGGGTTDYAPYFPTWTWDDGGTYPYSNLVDLRNKTGMPGVTLAFVLSGGGCQTDDAVTAHVADIKQFVAMGGHVKASFGGAGGTYIEAGCNDADALAGAIGAFVDQTGINDLDFDIEQDAAYGLSDLRGLALKKLQDAKGTLVSFTLPTGPDGLGDGGKQVVQGALKAGVTISHVNLMTMDYGQFQGQPLGPIAIGSVEGARGQLQAMIPGLGDAQAYGMLGATPMIGTNDSGEMFSLDDAALLAKFARDKGLGLISFWAISRDRVCDSGKDGCSTVNSGSFDFHNILKSAQQ
jgi:chitinase